MLTLSSTTVSAAIGWAALALWQDQFCAVISAHHAPGRSNHAVSSLSTVNVGWLSLNELDAAIP
jgi:hypothetical protein